MILLAQAPECWDYKLSPLYSSFDDVIERWWKLGCAVKLEESAFFASTNP
jgi:hypothetical protein